MNLDYHALLPEIILASTVMLVLVVDLLPVDKYWTAVVGLLGTSAAIVPLLTLHFCSSLSFCESTGTRSMFSDAYVVDSFSLVLKGLFLVVAVVVLLLSVGYIESGQFWQGEYYFLLLSSVLGAVVMASSRDFISMFVGLELVTAPTFLMAGWRKGDARSNEAALKYFIIGVISAAILLFGISLVYGATGELRFVDVAASIAVVGETPLLTIGILFTVLGFAFKVSAAPFHFWTPDTYEGAPTPVTAYLSVGSKTAGFVGLLTITYIAFGTARGTWAALIWILAVSSMIIGNVVAVKQTNIVRMLGYSSIAQGGFMLVPFGALVGSDIGPEDLERAFFATVTYVLIYAAMNLGAFATVIAISDRIKSGDIKDLAGLGAYAPGLAGLLAVFFISLAGLPPLGGWFAKLAMFNSAIGPGSSWGLALAVIAAINAVVAFAYYGGVVKSAWFDSPPDTISPEMKNPTKVAPPLALALGITFVATILFGVLPNVITNMSDLASSLVSGL
ncbi:MAG: NADH-quinone oxidoreductase subunit N [Acidobacteria bacterium]|nr:NADH-quinone oxidoreductase subunit N [Acidobacteriota bacterium]